MKVIPLPGFTDVDEVLRYKRSRFANRSPSYLVCLGIYKWLLTMQYYMMSF